MQFIMQTVSPNFSGIISTLIKTNLCDFPKLCDTHVAYKFMGNSICQTRF